MKFAKELEQEAVPEWRIKYLNYKAGKKYVKAVSRALNRVNANTPGSSALHRTPTFFSPSLRPTHETFRTGDRDAHYDDGKTPSMPPATADSKSTRAQPVPASSSREREALRKSSDNLQYGSFVATPPDHLPDHHSQSGHDPVHRDFELPAPAMKVPSQQSAHSRAPPDTVRRTLNRLTMQRSSSVNAVPTSPGGTPNMQALPKRGTASTTYESPPSQLRRLFTHTSTVGRFDRSKTDIGMHSFDLVREREREFFEFLDAELDKVEGFYKMKEGQAGERLNILRVQLHEMRNRRLQELAEDRYREGGTAQNGPRENGHDKSNGWVQPIKSKIFPPGPNSKALQKMTRTPVLNPMRRGDAARDYIRRPEDHEVSYRTAKRKLKLAMQEFYRGLELLKSYALLNRTAFRKLNKKYDKAVNARPPYRYLNEKVNKSWFVNSDVLEGHIRAVEDLYARYFERGNHKLAAGKLRSLTKKPLDQSGSTFQNGLLVGTGAVFNIQGVIYGAQLLFHDDSDVRAQTSYLMQIYGGYFLMLFLLALFCLDCSLWTKNKVNYPFIFEFDQRHHLDWRQLAQFPSFFFLMLGVFMWLNFSRYGPEEMYLYYPVILIGITAITIFLPAPILWHRSRRWFVYSHWRLLLAGIYPVEFRDFFLGDIYCSLTYATANVELFFCLYANHWDDPVQCNSSHSRLLGFFTALPPIWRFLQCIRRYKDTRNVFPHLVNCGKYTMTIIAAVTLSFYRIHGSRTNLAVFVMFSVLNSIYCSIWDLFMDFSLIQSQSRYFLLRDILALKSKWPYYLIMVIDPVLRFAWIFYAIFTHDTQHSTIVSFMVAFMEVTRRGMWALFRVENEHCANVSQYKASRDVPLPYRIEPLMSRASTDDARESRDGERAEAGGEDRRAGAAATGVASAEAGTVRRRADTMSSRRNFSRIMAEAHKQDFEKRRRPVDQEAEEEEAREENSDDDEEEDEGEEAARFMAENAHEEGRRSV